MTETMDLQSPREMQNKEQLPGSTDANLSIHQLYHYALQSLARLHALIDCRQCILENTKTAIQQSLVYLYMWAQGLDLRFVEVSIAKKTRLQWMIISELAGIVKLVLVLSDGKMRVNPRDPSQDEIAILRGKYATETDLNDTDSDSPWDEDDESEPEEESVPSLTKTLSFAQINISHRKHVEMVQQLDTCVRCLMDLLPTLEHHRDEHLEKGVEEEMPSFNTGEQPLTVIHPYTMRVQDKFSSISIALATRLGEANWIRFQRLQHPYETNYGFSSRAQTVVAISEFQDSGLGTSVPGVSKYARSATSHTSMLTTASSRRHGVVRVPSTPEAVRLGMPFTCQICTKTLSDIRNRIDWKLHVFSDLRPYICTVEDCDQPRKTFSTRKQWVDHEFNEHRFREIWRCFQCKQDYATNAFLLSHLKEAHPEATSMLTVDRTIVLDACRKLINDVLKESCPMCGKCGFGTKHEWSSHVGRHMEEIALVVLPRSVDSDDDEEEEEEEDDEKEEAAAAAVQDEKVSHSTAGTFESSGVIPRLPPWYPVQIPTPNYHSSSSNSSDTDDEDEVSRQYKYKLRDRTAWDLAMRRQRFEKKFQGPDVRERDRKKGNGALGPSKLGSSDAPDKDEVEDSPVDRAQQSKDDADLPDKRERDIMEEQNADLDREPVEQVADSAANSVEIFKSFRIGIEDPCYKVLPAALRKYNIQADWRQYALYIVYGNEERVVGLAEQPLKLFKELDQQGKKPMFMLRKLANPVSLIDIPDAS